MVINRSTYVLGTYSGSQAGIYRTTDGGVTWTLAQAGSIVGRPLVTADGRIYWLLNTSDLYVSSDQGVSWTLVSGRTVTTSAPVELPGGRLGAIAGGGRLATSSDGGATWESVGPVMPIKPNGLAYSAARNAFYIWWWDCNFTPPDPVPADAVQRLDLAPLDAVATDPASTSSAGTLGSG
jgi:hypothetical protein